MATTSTPIQIFVNGFRDSTGAVLASGHVRFYSPGTLTAQTVYSDAACTTAYSQPISLNAYGQAAIYPLEPVRCIVKDSGDATTYYDDIVNLTRHDAVYVTSSGINGGAETTLENVLATATTSLGAGFQYKESTGATARSYSTWLGELTVSVKDFGAAGDGTSDDTTAIQNTIARVKARGGGWVYFPKGTYRITSALTIDTAGVSLRGAGRGIAVISNASTTGNAISFDLGSTGDSKAVFENFSVTAGTTSSGKAIVVANGDRIEIHNVAVALHRTGFDVSAVAAATLITCLVESTDDNASAVGITLGTRGRTTDCEAISGTTNGTGINCNGVDGRALDCYVNKFSTGIALAGSRSQSKGCHVASATTGILGSGAYSITSDAFVTGATTAISLTATDSKVRHSSISSSTTGVSLGAAYGQVASTYVTGATTGFSVGAFAGCIVENCAASGNTTDLSVNASATLLKEAGNQFATYSDAVNLAHNWLALRALNIGTVTKVTSSSNTGYSITPTPATCQTYVAENTGNNAGNITLTVNATGTTGLVDGQLFLLVLQKPTTSTGGITPSFNAQYIAPSPTVIAITSHSTFLFRWAATTSHWITVSAVQNIGNTPPF